MLSWLSDAFAGCRFLEAGDGETAVAIADREHPALAVMDIRMPGINGIETTRRIKAVSPDTRVVIHSILDAPEYRAEAQAAGAEAYVAKTEAALKLIPAIRRLLETASNGSEAP